ncbi:MAG: hypothetical protein JO172_01370, partial [Hyphomicrobiales bacterium]|nr:hypothetical protein [Hyphomicrobiales bacterium]
MLVEERQAREDSSGQDQGTGRHDRVCAQPDLIADKSTEFFHARFDDLAIERDPYALVFAFIARIGNDGARLAIYPFPENGVPNDIKVGEFAAFEHE